MFVKTLVLGIFEISLLQYFRQKKLWNVNMNNDSGFPENSRPLDFVFLLPKGVGCTIMPYKERQALLERLRDCITTANFSSFTFATYVTHNFQKHNLDKHAAVLKENWKINTIRETNVKIMCFFCMYL